MKTFIWIRKTNICCLIRWRNRQFLYQAVAFPGLKGELLVVHRLSIKLRKRVSGGAAGGVHAPIHLVQACGHRLPLLGHLLLFAENLGSPGDRGRRWGRGVRFRSVFRRRLKFERLVRMWTDIGELLKKKRAPFYHVWSTRPDIDPVAKSGQTFFIFRPRNAHPWASIGSKGL